MRANQKKMKTDGTVSGIYDPSFLFWEKEEKTDYLFLIPERDFTS